MKTWQEIATHWQNFETLDASLLASLAKMDNDEKMEAFIQPLSFGTAGMRGMLGPGINRMNIYTVRQASLGLAKFIKKAGGSAMKRGVVIAYDSRHMSPEFAKEAAAVLVKNDIQAYIFDALRPTPTLSFAVRHLDAYAGIMITASHNPAEYNGYKVYGEDGGQMPPAAADQLTAFVREVEDPLSVEVLEDEQLADNPLYTVIGNKVDQAYLHHMKSVQVNPELNQEMGSQISIIYSPLHGTGLDLGMRALKQSGYDNVHVVASQAQADGSFPTVVSPNPESQAAFSEAIKMTEEIPADIILATDPDADRLGAMIKNADNRYQLLTGNQIASLMLDYILRARQERGDMPENGVIIKSIVSTDLARMVAQYYGAEMLEVLTGFKFIAEKIKSFESQPDKTFLFGFEESYGYLVKPFSRDKDAIQSLVVLAELTAYHKKHGRTLAQALEDLYQKFGYFKEKTISITFPGVQGREMMDAIMKQVRKNTPDEIAGLEVETFADYSVNQYKDKHATLHSIGLPLSNAVKFNLENGSWVALRPSGTEPKLKLYIGVKASTNEEAIQLLTSIEEEITSWTEI